MTKTTPFREADKLVSDIYRHLIPQSIFRDGKKITAEHRAVQLAILSIEHTLVNLRALNPLRKDNTIREAKIVFLIDEYEAQIEYLRKKL